MTSTDSHPAFAAAERLAPEPTSREDATVEGWARHYAHSVCPDCQAVNHGNIDCATCVKTWECNAETRSVLLAAIEGKQA